jgi:hypothetical protein
LVNVSARLLALLYSILPVEQDQPQSALLQARLELTEQKVREIAALVPFFPDPVKRAECRAMVESLRQEAESIRREIEQVAKGAAG